jgi:hypothetical protein
MLKIASILAFSVVASILSLEAQALPGSPASHEASPDLVPVRGFCGLGAHRGPYGYCVPNGVPYGYVAPVVVAPRVVCPYGMAFYPAYGRCM